MKHALFALMLLVCTQFVSWAAEDKPPPLPTDGKDEAVKAAEAWLSALDERNYIQTYTNAATQLRKTVSKKKWQSTMAPLREPLGKLTSRQLKSVVLTREIEGAPDAQYAVAEFTTTFANKAGVTERVILVWGRDGRWCVSSYSLH